jgi:hypothetical protein
MKYVAAMVLCLGGFVAPAALAVVNSPDYGVSPIPIDAGKTFTFAAQLQGSFEATVWVSIKYGSTVYQKTFGPSKYGTIPSDNIILLSFPASFVIPTTPRGQDVSVYISVVPKGEKPAIGQLAFVLTPHCPQSRGVCQYATALDWAKITPVKP